MHRATSATCSGVNRFVVIPIFGENPSVSTDMSPPRSHKRHTREKPIYLRPPFLSHCDLAKTVMIDHCRVEKFLLTVPASSPSQPAYAYPRSGRSPQEPSTGQWRPGRGPTDPADSVDCVIVRGGKAMLRHELVLDGEDDDGRSGRKQRDESQLPERERWQEGEIEGDKRERSRETTNLA
ncbi:hypothetical protein ACLOJK_001525 [Asimina triloba]